MKTKNARTVGVRLDPQEAARLKDFEESTGIEAVSLYRNAGAAALTYYEQHRTLTFPLRIAPSESQKETLHKGYPSKSAPPIILNDALEPDATDVAIAKIAAEIKAAAAGQKKAVRRK